MGFAFKTFDKDIFPQMIKLFGSQVEISEQTISAIITNPKKEEIESMQIDYKKNMKSIIFNVTDNNYISIDIDTEIIYKNKTYVVRKIDEITENIFICYCEEMEIKRFGKDRK